MNILNLRLRSLSDTHTHTHTYKLIERKGKGLKKEEKTSSNLVFNLNSSIYKLNFIHLIENNKNKTKKKEIKIKYSQKDLISIL
jgi:hypothetical protein